MTRSDLAKGGKTHHDEGDPTPEALHHIQAEESATLREGMSRRTKRERTSTRTYEVDSAKKDL